MSGIIHEALNIETPSLRYFLNHMCLPRSENLMKFPVLIQPQNVQGRS